MPIRGLLFVLLVAAAVGLFIDSEFGVLPWEEPYDEPYEEDFEDENIEEEEEK